MFARAHRSPDPKSCSTLANFPLLDFSRAFKHPHIFLRFSAPPHFPALLSTPTFSRAYLLHCSFPLFFPISPIQCFQAPINSCILFHVRHLSAIPQQSHYCTLALQQHALESPFCLTIRSSRKFFCFLFYSSHCMLISYHNR